MKKEEKFFCPHKKCKDYDSKNEYGCKAQSAGSSAPYPLFCTRINKSKV